MRSKFVLLLASLVLAGVLVTAVAAQDATQEATAEATSEMNMTATEMPADTTATGVTSSSEMVTCDSDLILSLYIAERYFNFGAIHDQMMANDSSVSMDLANLDKGQYMPLFDSMMTMMNSDMSMSGSMMTDEQMTSMSDMMAMGDMNMLPASATTLEASSMSDEQAACSSLRAELRQFYNALAYQDLRVSPTTSMDMTATVMPSADMVSVTGMFSGPAEVPGPGDADAVGSVTVSLDVANSQVCYDINVQSIDLPATAAHIHRGEFGVKGDVVVPFDNAPGADGMASGCVTVDSALIAEIAANPTGFYVNVHNALLPDGAARAQLDF